MIDMKGTWKLELSIFLLLLLSYCSLTVQVLSVLWAARSSVKVQGVHVHLGSAITDISVYAKVMQSASRVLHQVCNDDFCVCIHYKSLWIFILIQLIHGWNAKNKDGKEISKFVKVAVQSRGSIKHAETVITLILSNRPVHRWTNTRTAFAQKSKILYGDSYTSLELPRLGRGPH